MHLDPARFGVTSGGDIVAWKPPPTCPLCRAKLGVLSDCDIREAVIAAIELQGTQLRSFSQQQQYSPPAALLHGIFPVFGHSAA
jgi:hypothetical protein